MLNKKSFLWCYILNIKFIPGWCGSIHWSVIPHSERLQVPLPVSYIPRLEVQSRLGKVQEEINQCFSPHVSLKSMGMSLDEDICIYILQSELFNITDKSYQIILFSSIHSKRISFHVCYCHSKVNLFWFSLIHTTSPGISYT